MGADENKVPNKIQSNRQNKIKNDVQNTIQIQSFLKNIKSKYILKQIFDNIEKDKVFKLINYNKSLQNRLEIGLDDYKNKFLNIIKIEIIPKINSGKGKFVNYIVDENKYHIYFDEETNERKTNSFSLTNRASKVKITLYFEESSLKGLFKDCECIEKINFIRFKRKDIIDMSYMFYGCTSLKEVNLSNLITDNVKDMSFMFYKCQSLTELNLSKFNTKELINMKSIFSRCSSLAKIDLSNLDTRNVEDMSYMFYECYYLNDVNLSKLIVKKLKNVSYMFYGCYSIQELNLANFDLNSALIEKKLVFSGCSSLKVFKVKGYYRGDVKDMFKGCSDDLIFNLEYPKEI